MLRKLLAPSRSLSPSEFILALVREPAKLSRRETSSREYDKPTMETIHSVGQAN